ncbi:MAG: glycosyltransferase family 39 protein [Deltaproteobacteria bacterium]|nr:glycosyltransferase family 39 protein [Deltaproteobacteria bacterium]
MFSKRSEVNDVNPAVSIGILTAAGLLCMVPFIGKSFHIDEYLFLAAAKHILNNPMNFYGFAVNWYGWEMPMSEVMKNPPFASYYIAAVAYLFGWGETTLHGAFLLPALAAVIGTFCLGRQTCSQPLAAALAALTTPVFLVSATSVMCDVLMLAFWVWAVYCWMVGLKNDRLSYLIMSSVLIACCSLTKYFGMALLPLLLVYSLYAKKKAGRWICLFLIPVSILALYNLGTQGLYGRGLLMDAAQYASNVKGISGNVLKEFLVALGFTGGCLLTCLFFSPCLWRRWVPVLGALSILGVVLLMHWFFTGSLQSIAGNMVFLLHMAFFIMAAVSLLAATTADVLRTKHPDALLFFLWIWGTFFFTGFFNWTINGRSVLPMVPAACIVLVRVMDQQGVMDKLSNKPWRWAIPLIPALLIALLVAHADRTLADTAQKAAKTIHSDMKKEKSTLWFEGHWGFQYYMEKLGGRPLDSKKMSLKAGDLVVVPRNNTNTFKLPPSSVELKLAYRFQPFRFAATMDRTLGAGFYSNIWGPLPFAFGKAPQERYDLYEVIK